VSHHKKDCENSKQGPPQSIGGLVRHDCENDADHDADQRDEISYAEGHFDPASFAATRRRRTRLTANS
jgi:hypothetical protein